MKYIYLLLIAIVLTGVACADGFAAKAAVPDAATINDTKKAIDEAYQDIIAKASTQQKQDDLAKRFLEDGTATGDNAAGRFVLLGDARDWACRAGDAVVAIKAVDQLESSFEIDGLKMKVDALSSAAKTAGSARSVNVFRIALGIVDQAVAVDRYPEANQAAAVALFAASIVDNAGMQKKASQRATEVLADEAGYRALKGSLAALAQDPADAKANLAVGKFRCFVKGDWSGLVMLALSGNAVLKDLADQELSTPPTSAEDQIKLGDAWWAVAEKESGLSKTHIRQHAGVFYQKSMANLSGFDKARLEARLKELPQEEDLTEWVELLDTVTGSTGNQKEGAIVLHNERITTAGRFAAPVSLRVVAATENTNIRIAFAANQIIFNWEGNQDELRVDGGPANGRHKMGAGRVPINRWVTFEITVLKDSMTISVDGVQRYSTNADFSHVDQPLSVFSAEGSTIMVKSICILNPVTVKDESADTAPPRTLWNGSGVALNEDGLILTNRHVVKDSRALMVLMGDKHVPAEVVAIDDAFDLALIRVKTDQKLPFLKLAAADNPKEGANVLVMGYPMADKFGTTVKITRGIVSEASAKVEDGADTMTDAKVNPGNSGGPILDDHGNIIALVCMKSLASEAEESYGIGISAGHIRAFLAKQKITLPAGDAGAAMSNEDVIEKSKPSVFCIFGAK